MRKKSPVSSQKKAQKRRKQGVKGHSTNNTKTVDDLFHALQRQEEVLQEILLWDDFIKTHKKQK